MKTSSFRLAALAGVASTAFAGAGMAQDQTLAYTIFSGTGPGAFNFADNGEVQAITLDSGGTTVSGPATTLAQGGTGDTTFFFDSTSQGDLFIANGSQGSVVDSSFSSVGAANDAVGVAVDEANGYLFWSSRADGNVYRASLNVGTGAVGASSVFLSGLTEPTALHITSGSRLLIGTNGAVSAVDPNNAATLTTLANDVGAQVRGLEEDVVYGTIYYSTDAADNIATVPSAGGVSTNILSGGGSFQDLLLDEVNDRLILANFAVSGGFDTDGAIISYGLDRIAGTLTDGGVTLVTQAELVNPGSENAYFTGLDFVVPEPGTFALLGLGSLAALRRRRA